MIYSQATGGLGNQLFNYAIGYALAKEYNDQLTIDISPYRFSPRPFVLDQFSITSKVSSISPALFDHKFFRIFGRLFRKLLTFQYGPCKWIKEEDFSKNAFFQYDFSHKKSLYLEGYWQHYLYFHKFRDQLLEEFQLKEEFLSKNALELQEKLLHTQSVSLHIRRGDYEDKWLLPITYYHDAISYIKSKYDDAHFYIFCEDLDYSIKHFGTKEDCTIIANSFSFSDLEEFHLISKCKHQIIANSSFSWWAAYLNTNTDSTIIAPIFLQWTKEYYPPEWITLS